MRLMSRTKFHALVGSGLTTLLVSVCMVMPPAQAAPAVPGESDDQAPGVARTSEIAPAYPAGQSSEVAQPEVTWPAPRPTSHLASGPVTGVLAFPQGGPGPQHAGPPHGGPRPPGHRPGLPGRHHRLGQAARLSIEPTAGPVGTTITIYGDFSGVRNPNQLGVTFAGQRGVARPVYVASDRIAVIVPKGARTGPVAVKLRNRAAWQGRFAVTPRDSDIFLPTPVDSGLVGAVYRLRPGTDRLPDFDNIGAPYATIVVPSLKVSPRRFDAGFPGLDDTSEPLLEWFAIRFVGRLWVPAPGNYQFRLNSDDGARLYIEDRLVIDNDGQHPPRARDGSMHLAAGSHDIVVEYYQGPRYEIALELSWRQGGQGWSLVPPEAFTRYTSGYECSSEPQIFCCQGNAPQCRACRDNARRVTDEWRARCTGVAPPGYGPGPAPAPINCSVEPQRMCCQAQSPQCNQCRDTAAAERAAWMQACGGPGGPVTSPINCQREPQRACCRANTPACKQCQREAAAEREQWQRRCDVPPPGRPAPINCSVEPRRICCEANTAECRQCQQKAATERREWAQRCDGPPPGGPKPAPINCSVEPKRICCKANTPACQQCQQTADRERMEWQRACGQGSVDCSKRPSQACCRALTPACNECRDKARAETERWQAACSR